MDLSVFGAPQYKWNVCWAELYCWRARHRHKEHLPQASREVEEAVRDSAQMSVPADLPHCSSGFLPTLIAIRNMCSMCEDDIRKGGWLLALCLFILPPNTLDSSGIYFSSFTASSRYSHLFFGAQSKSTWSKLVSLGLYCFLLYCAPTHFPVLQQNGGPRSYGQTAGAHVRATWVEEQFLKWGVYKCDCKQLTQGTESPNGGDNKVNTGC